MCRLSCLVDNEIFMALYESQEGCYGPAFEFRCFNLINFQSHCDLIGKIFFSRFLIIESSSVVTWVRYRIRLNNETEFCILSVVWKVFRYLIMTCFWTRNKSRCSSDVLSMLRNWHAVDEFKAINLYYFIVAFSKI